MKDGVVHDYKAIKEALNERGYKPIYDDPEAAPLPPPKPKCPRWIGETCHGSCAGYTDCKMQWDREAASGD